MPLRPTTKTDAHPQKRQTAALTLIEVLVIITTIAILAGLLLPALSTGGSHMRIKCVSNLKQVGVSYRLWASENGDKFPMQIRMTNGKVVEPAFTQTPATIFQVMSNQLADPKILVCPQDTNHWPATNFSSKLKNFQVSYFVGLDADEKLPARFLSGDRNLTNGTRLRQGVLELTTNQPAGWTGEIHKDHGNIGFADGSVQQLNNARLQKAVQDTGLATNRLAMP